jgi:hypothetical protein
MSSEHASARGAGRTDRTIRSAGNRFIGTRHDVADDVVANDRLSFRAAIAGVHSWACIAVLASLGLHRPARPQALRAGT